MEEYDIIIIFDKDMTTAQAFEKQHNYEDTFLLTTGVKNEIQVKDVSRKCEVIPIIGTLDGYWVGYKIQATEQAVEIIKHILNQDKSVSKFLVKDTSKTTNTFDELQNVIIKMTWDSKSEPSVIFEKTVTDAEDVLLGLAKYN